MKKIIIILSVVLGLQVGANAQWLSQSSGTNNHLYSVYFTDANTGYAVGDYGTIRKTSDGGSTWSAQTSGTPSSYPLLSVYFTDVNTGYVVGYNGIILKTINGGSNWSAQSSGITGWLSSVYFTDANTGYAVGEQGTILKTINGGSNWSAQTSGIANDLFSVYFTNTNTGYAVGEQGTILKTINGGSNWSAQTSGTTDDLYSVYFTNANTGYAVGSYGIILKTINGGSDWSAQTSGTTGDLNSVYFVGANTGYIVGNSGIILKTSDGGSNWSAQTSGTTEWFISVYFIDACVGYVVGYEGKISKTISGSVPFIADAGTNQSICPGENATLTATGGVSYLWSTGATMASIIVLPITTTTYTVTVTSAEGCIATDNVIVTVDYVPANAGADKIICQGQSVILTASGGTFYTWSTGATTTSIIVSPTTTTTYTVTAINSCGSATDNVVVNVNSLPVANAGTDTAICIGQSIVLTASGGDIYLWNTNATTASITVSPTATTTYTVTVTNFCGSTTDNVVVTVTVPCVGITDITTINNFIIYPNPATDNITIESPQQAVMEISNIQGQLIKTLVTSNNKTSVDVSAFSNGMYFIKAKTEKGIAIKKFVKE
ncbi:MAG: YCF48-related protein [Bacteroidota bacterium]